LPVIQNTPDIFFYFCPDSALPGFKVNELQWFNP